MLFRFPRPAFLFFLLTLSLLGRAAQAGPPAAGATSSLAQALNPDGTLRAEASGSFDARQFTMQTAADGRPVFRPSGTTGAGDFRWQDGFGLANGTNGNVLAVVCAGTATYVGGTFSAVGNVMANRVAKWDGTAWSALGTGIGNINAATGPDAVRALAVSGSGDLYAGGTFTQAGGVAANGIARWNGTAWSSLGTGVNNVGTYNEGVYALAMSGSGEVYAGGSFTQAGGVAANRVAKWNGTAWSALGTGIATSANGSVVYALAVSGSGDVYAVGRFGQAGGVVVSNVTKWDGTAWSSLGTGIGDAYTNVYALAVSGSGEVYVGGRFRQAGGVAANYVAKWNGAAWSALGTGISSPGISDVYALAVSGSGEVYVGGGFSLAGGRPANNVAKWNGTAWSSLGTGANNGVGGFTVYALALSGSGEVHVGGWFGLAGGVAANNISKWDGTAWSTLGTRAGNGVNGQVIALAVTGNREVYVGGRFDQAGGVAANNIVKWNGTAWSALGTGAANGVNGVVIALAVSGSGEVYGGGSFTQAGGVAANNIAKWNGTAWSSMGTGAGNGVAGLVRALAISGNGEVYAGGSFTQAGGVAANNIAKWNGTAWSSMGAGAGNGFNGLVLALAVAGNGAVYAGGEFNKTGDPAQIGGVAANRIAKWNGTAWSALGTGLGNGMSSVEVVNALAVSSTGEVYAGGSFTQAGSVAASFIAKWNGTTWSSLGTGANNGVGNVVSALGVSGSGEVYAGGNFTQAGGVAASFIAKWNGTTWNSLGTGLNGRVVALAWGSANKLYAGGEFSTVGDYTKATAHFAIYDPAAVSATAPAIPRKTLTPTPNPAHGPATLTLPPTATARAGQVLDGLGRVVRAFVVPAQAGTAALPVGGLPAGAYVVRVGAASGRLVVE